MSEVVQLPENIQGQVDELLKMGHPLPANVSSTKFVAKKYGFTELAEWLEEPENASKYVSYVMTCTP